ncbi:hypothetical protein FHG87_016690 [Trinorchestia longiramus]|nr:hypothetical protein FHG87_016690 [Trinorchestia longiramus]
MLFCLFRCASPPVTLRSPAHPVTWTITSELMATGRRWTGQQQYRAMQHFSQRPYDHFSDKLKQMGQRHIMDSIPPTIALKLNPAQAGHNQELPGGGAVSSMVGEHWTPTVGYGAGPYSNYMTGGGAGGGGSGVHSGAYNAGSGTPSLGYTTPELTHSITAMDTTPALPGSSSSMMEGSPSTGPTEYELPGASAGEGSASAAVASLHDTDRSHQEFKQEYKQEYMLSGYSSPDLRTSTMMDHSAPITTNSSSFPTDHRGISSELRGTNDLSCSPFTPPVPSTSSPAVAPPGTIFPTVGINGAPPGGALSPYTGAVQGCGNSSATAAAAAATGYSGYIGGTYYAAQAASGQNYLGTSIGVLYPHLYQQQGQFLIDRQDQYPRHDYRELPGGPTPMLEDQAMQARYLASRAGSQSSADVVWRPY